jgi:hypothetical protein
MKKFIVEITGGLGNQMFQYAFGKALAIANKCPLKLDLTLYETYEDHEYSLKPFCIEAEIASQREIKTFRFLNGTVIDKIKRRIFGMQPPVLKERDLLFDAIYKSARPSSYLIGFWQCEKYFESIAPLIREHFKIKIPPSEANQIFLNKIKSVDAVSLHIRRGNYVSVDSNFKRHGTCSLEYYQEAMKIIEKYTTNAVYFVFSNDIPWAKEHLSITAPHYFVDINSEKTDYEDLRLMSSCKYHIIANSTFSWWAAWLCNREGKKVVAPKQWFLDQELNKQSLTIVPESWQRI